ncbi:hypothetical protein HYV82_00330 [Candidatus Woesearchaeota archaeon]|nr:hypothetical protein [Candidatus Woesearchaeota archaeon]
MTPKEVFTYALILLAAILLLGCTTTEKTKNLGGEDKKEEATKSLNDYYSSIDYSCKASSDCEIKNVANCCGQYPQCVNKNAKTNPELVKALCEKEGAASYCGFPSISSCECVNNRCEGR